MLGSRCPSCAGSGLWRQPAGDRVSKKDLLQHGTADLIRALLPTLDGFERALKHRDASVPEAFFHGLDLIYRELTDVLRRAGLTPVEAEGKIFDPHLHQAVEMVESPGHRDHEIVAELQRGYRLKQRLLRPAVVKVAVAPRSTEGAEDSDGATAPPDDENFIDPKN